MNKKEIFESLGLAMVLSIFIGMLLIPVYGVHASEYAGTTTVAQGTAIGKDIYGAVVYKLTVKETFAHEFSVRGSGGSITYYQNPPTVTTWTFPGASTLKIDKNTEVVVPGYEVHAYGAAQYGLVVIWGQWNTGELHEDLYCYGDGYWYGEGGAGYE